MGNILTDWNNLGLGTISDGKVEWENLVFQKGKNQLHG